MYISADFMVDVFDFLSLSNPSQSTFFFQCLLVFSDGGLYEFYVIDG